MFVNVIVNVNIWLYMQFVYMCMQSDFFYKCQKFIKTVFSTIAEIRYIRRLSLCRRT
jgi:hypothetical protein